VDIAPTFVNLARGPVEPSFVGRSLVPDLEGGAGDRSRRVFQEVSSERGKKRAFVTADRHLIWNWVPDNTTECYDRTRDAAEVHDIWGRADDACRALKLELQRLVAGLALPAGAAEKLARGVVPPGGPVLRPSHPFEAQLGDAVAVRGYDLRPAEVHPGGEVEVAYYFTARKRVADRWRLFFHLEGPAGYRNVDHVPVEGMMPLDRWRPGQQIRDLQRIAIPRTSPPGVYTLYLGAFRGAERLPVTPRALSDGRDRLRVATFVVR
jgi:hypothetical protein